MFSTNSNYPPPTALSVGWKRLRHNSHLSSQPSEAGRLLVNSAPTRLCNHDFLAGILPNRIAPRTCHNRERPMAWPGSMTLSWTRSPSPGDPQEDELSLFESSTPGVSGAADAVADVDASSARSPHALLRFLSCFLSLLHHESTQENDWRLGAETKPLSSSVHAGEEALAETPSLGFHRETWHPNAEQRPSQRCPKLEWRLQ